MRNEFLTYGDRLASLENDGSASEIAICHSPPNKSLYLSFEGPLGAQYPFWLLHIALQRVGSLLGISLTAQRSADVPPVVIVPTYLFTEAKYFYAAKPKISNRKDELYKQWLAAVSSAARSAAQQTSEDGLVLVHDLIEPCIVPSGIQDLSASGGTQECIWEANLALAQTIRDLDDPRVRLVPVHRVLNPDLIAVAQLNNLQEATDQLIRVGRTARASYLWQSLLDAAWFHYHWIYSLAFPTKKLIAIDLDETVWRGILAEDGVDGLASGWTPQTIGFCALQARMQAMSEQGTLLCAISRNDPILARDAIERFAPGLRFSALRISPTINKPSAIINICRDLGGINPDSTVFIDDNDLERAEVSKVLPAVIVPPFVSPPALSDDTFLHLPQVERLRILPEDQQRVAFFEAQRVGGLQGYRREVRGYVNPTSQVILSRLADLHRKTNQFNMTTSRSTLTELQALTSHEDCFLIAFEVELLDSGLQPEIAGCAEVRCNGSHDWTIASFLMSCRYMGGGSDRRMLSVLLDEVERRDGKTVKALYKPTERNVGFRNWYPSCGFRPCDKTVYADDTVHLQGEIGTLRPWLDVNQTDSMCRYLAEHVHPLVVEGVARTRTRRIDGAIEVYVPGGSFVPGLSAAAAEAVTRIFGLEPIGETNRILTTVSPFWMDQTCISQAQFCDFLGHTVYDPSHAREIAAELAGTQDCTLEFDENNKQLRPVFGTDRRPAVVSIAWAERYAAWAGGRLPSEDEWEWAARGHDGRWFPWGNEAPDGLRLCCRDPAATCNVNEFYEGASPFGLLGLTANVWQWCAGEYRGHPQYRGGDHTVESAYFLRVTLRPLESAEHCAHPVGIRLIRDANSTDTDTNDNMGINP